MTITCPQCKYQNPDDAEFCENCGAQLPVSVPAGAAAPSYGSGPIPAPAVPPPSSQLACPNCRAPLATGDEFCFNCGTDVRNLTRGPAPVGNQPFNPSANTNMVDPNAPTTVSPVTPLKDDDINRMLAEMDNPGQAPVRNQNSGPVQGQNSGPIPAPAPMQNQNSGPALVPVQDPDEANAQTVHAIPSGNLSASNSGPVSQPSQPAPPPPAAQSSGGSIPVPPGPSGGVAGNAFGAPTPAPSGAATPAANPPIIGGTLSLQISGPYGEERVDWKGTEILLGRNDVKTRVFPEVNLDDSAASRRHLSIWLDEIDSRYYAQDLESANGTVLNDRDLKPGEPTMLNNGDVLKIGTRYTIKVQIS